VSGDGLTRSSCGRTTWPATSRPTRTFAVRLGPPAERAHLRRARVHCAEHHPNASFTAAPSFGSSCPGAGDPYALRADTYVDAAQPVSSFATAAPARGALRGPARTRRALLGFRSAGGEPAAWSRRPRCAFTPAVRPPDATLAAYRLGSAMGRGRDVEHASGNERRSGRSRSPTAAGELRRDRRAAGRVPLRGQRPCRARRERRAASPAAGQAFDSSEGDPALRPQLVVSFG